MHWLIQRFHASNSGPKGRNTIAQGNALGPIRRYCCSPERAKQNVVPRLVTPFQGYIMNRTLHPGRCPGLSYRGPLGLNAGANSSRLRIMYIVAQPYDMLRPTTRPMELTMRTLSIVLALL